MNGQILTLELEIKLLEKNENLLRVKIHMQKTRLERVLTNSNGANVKKELAKLKLEAESNREKLITARHNLAKLIFRDRED